MAGRFKGEGRQDLVGPQFYIYNLSDSGNQFPPWPYAKDTDLDKYMKKPSQFNTNRFPTAKRMLSAVRGVKTILGLIVSWIPVASYQDMYTET